MKLDILVFSSHPDDAELGCAGTILSHISMGYKVGIVDLTQGELGTRGSAHQRAIEANEAAKILGISFRENLCLPDGFFSDSREECLKVISAIRRYQPEIILANAPTDRHPDHGRGAHLVSRASFLSGLIKIETQTDGKIQLPWRPTHLFHYIQDKYMTPDFVVDVTPFWEQKLAAILAFRTQFYNPEEIGPTTYISSPEFLDFLKGRALELGHSIGVRYGEGFIKEKQIEIKDLVSTFKSIA